jgi:beta-mannosidase
VADRIAVMEAGSVSSHRRRALADGWELAKGDRPASSPAELLATEPRWIPARAGTVAAILGSRGEWDVSHERDFDAEEWWFRCRFSAQPHKGTSAFLRFRGLATIAEVWLNGTSILRSENMFLEHAVDVTPLLKEANDLYLHFASLKGGLAQRRPRPRWRVRLVNQQQLRWFRTTLLGRMPGWSPPAAPVGPWRPIVLEEREVLDVLEAEVRPTLSKERGEISVRLRLRDLGNLPLGEGELAVGAHLCKLKRTEEGNRETTFSAKLEIPEVERWWPHTHGGQPMFPVKVQVSVGKDSCNLDLGQVGFRTIERLGDGEDFGLAVNGVPIFARGASWTTTDVVRLVGVREDYHRVLTLARDAGMNMLRVGGTFFYEDPIFHDLCDELGILVWQDFMFANMDYPLDDAPFRASVEAEVGQQLDRLALHPSLAVLCGNSELDQQRALLGLPRESAASTFFERDLLELCQARRPDVPYLSSSAGGGPVGIRVNRGPAHYYGVGAYLRPLEDARRSEVRFASECLAFANVPEQTSIDALLPDGEAPFHHPKWKRRVPRDVGMGWDFDDVRDHYLEACFNRDPATLRARDMERYLALSRVVSGEVMAATFTEWRRQQSKCKGGLMWFLQDLWLGAGWGVIDALGTPKACYYFLKRALKPVALGVTDEGLNGLLLHLFNDGGNDLAAEASLALYRDGEVHVASGERAITLPARGGLRICADEILERFFDSNYAYRFGPPGHDVAVAKLVLADGEKLEAFHFPLGMPVARYSDLGLAASLGRASDGGPFVTVRTRRLAQAVHLLVPGHLPEDNYFHLGPGTERLVRLLPVGSTAMPLVGTVRALNLDGAIRLREGP